MIFHFDVKEVIVPFDAFSIHQISVRSPYRKYARLFFAYMQLALNIVIDIVIFFQLSLVFFNWYEIQIACNRTIEKELGLVFRFYLNVNNTTRTNLVSGESHYHWIILSIIKNCVLEQMLFVRQFLITYWKNSNDYNEFQDFLNQFFTVTNNCFWWNYFPAYVLKINW